MLLSPYDYAGNICGMAGTNPRNNQEYDLRAYPKLAFTYMQPDLISGGDMVKNLFDKTVCVKACPKTSSDKLECSPQMLKDAKYKGFC